MCSEPEFQAGGGGLSLSECWERKGILERYLEEMSWFNKCQSEEGEQSWAMEEGEQRVSRNGYEQWEVTDNMAKSCLGRLQWVQETGWRCNL